MKKLYLVNCGYYERGLMDGLFEMHITLPVVAENVETAKVSAKAHEFFVSREIRVHVDGITELKEVSGYPVRFSENPVTITIN